MLKLVCFVSWILILPLHVVESLNVPIRVVASTPLSRSFPSQVVVPLPIGLIFDKDVLGLLEVPSQIKVLERWRADGSIRHVQVLFLIKATSSSLNVTFHLVDEGNYPNPASPVRVTKDSSSVTVNTGKIRFAVKRKNFNLFDRVWVDYDGNGRYDLSERIVLSNSTNGGMLVDYLNKIQRDSSRSDVRVTVEESGPLRAVIRAEAPTLFLSTTNHVHGFAVRIYAYAGQDYVAVDYQLQNSALVKRSWPLYFHEMNLNLNLNLATTSSAPTVTFGMTDGSTQTASSSSAYLAQELHDSCSIYSGGGTLLKRKQNLTYSNIKRGTGFVHIREKTTRKRSVSVVGRNIWQMWPNGLSVVKGKQLSVQLFPSWSAQWEGATDARPSGRISPTGLYWLKDMQHVYKSVLFVFHSTLPTINDVSKLALNFQYGPVASVKHDWYAQTRATLDLGGYVPPSVVAAETDTITPDSQWAWDFNLNSIYYKANVRNFGDPEGPYRAYPSTSGGWPYASSAFHASGYSSEYFLVELWGIGETNVRPQWLAGYNYSANQATLQLTENPYAGGTWRVFDGHGVSVYAAPLLPNTEDIAPDYGARDDQHGWFYQAMDSFFVTGNPWIKDWYTFIHEFRMVRLHQGDPFPDTSSRALGHSLAHAIQAGRVTGANDTLPAFRNYLVNYLIPNQDPRYGQQLTSVENRGGSFETGYLARTIISFMEEVRSIDAQGFADGFNYLSGLMAWNLNYGNFAYEFNADTNSGSVGQSSGTGLTIVDPQAWYYWNTGKQEYWNQILDFVDDGIDGGERPYGDGFQGWGGSFEGRMYQYVLQTPRGDVTPPALVNDLSATWVGSGQIIAEWTTPTGVTRFHLVWSNITISEQHTTSSTKRNWWACTAVGVDKVAVPGSKQTMQFTANGAKYVAMFVFDANNNMSPMSNIATVTILSPATPKPSSKPANKPVFPPTVTPVTSKPTNKPVLLPTLAESLNVPIRVVRKSALAQSFPSQVMVPLPIGLVFNVDVLGLLEVPSQVKVLERWRADGSIRHVQVLFLVDASSSLNATFHLVDSGNYPAPALPVSVTEDSSTVTVDSGKVRFTVKKTNFNLFDGVWVDYDGNGAYDQSERIVTSNSTNGGVLVDYLNKMQRDSSRSDVQVTVEESGPLRVVIRAEAPTLFESTTNHVHGFAVRIYAYAGQDYVAVDYQLQNSALVTRSWPLYFHEMNLNLNLNIASSAPTVTFGMTDGSTQTASSSSAYLAQELHNSYSIYSGGGTLLKRAQSLTYPSIKGGTGFVHIRDNQPSSSRSVTVVGRNFWQMWPNGLSVVNGKQLSVQLFPSWSAQWEAATDSRPYGRTSPTGLYWLKDMQHVYKSVLFAFHSAVPTINDVSNLALNFQYGPVASVKHDWYAQTRATLDLGGYVPPSVVASGLDTVTPDSQWAWDINLDQNNSGNYKANVRNFGDPEGPYRAYSATTGGWPYASSAFHASGYLSEYFLVELWGIGETNVRPQWLPGYKYNTNQATLQLTENPYAGGSWRLFEGHGVSIYAAPLLPNTENIAPDYGARDDQHSWFYHAMDSFFVTGNPWIKDWYTFIHEFRMVRLHQGDPFPDTSSRAMGHSLAHAIQAGRVTGANDTLPAFRNYLVNYLIPNQDPKYGQQLTSVENRGGSFETGYLARTIIAFMEEVRSIDPQGFAEGFNYLSGLMAWNLNYGNFAYEFNADTNSGSVGQSSGTGLTIVDPQAWYYWNTGKQEYWNQILDFVDDGINGGERPYGDGFQGWGGSYEGRIYQYVLQTPRGDVTPPAAINDLIASRAGSGLITTQWTTPTSTARFHLVWSNVTISEQHTTSSTKRNWWACTAVGVDKVAVPGSKQTVQFTANGAKYVSMFVFDANNNMSPMSNVATVTGNA